MIWGLIIGAILGFIIGYSVALSKDDCPREINGYRCRGTGCDHSPDLVREAKQSKRRNYWDGPL